MVVKKKEEFIKKTPEETDLETILEQRKARIKVIGCGGAGNNTATRLIESGAPKVEIIALNTDAQQLLYSKADKKPIAKNKYLII